MLRFTLLFILLCSFLTNISIAQKEDFMYLNNKEQSLIMSDGWRLVFAIDSTQIDYFGLNNGNIFYIIQDEEFYHLNLLNQGHQRIDYKKVSKRKVIANICSWINTMDFPYFFNSSHNQVVFGPIRDHFYTVEKNKIVKINSWNDIELPGLSKFYRFRYYLLGEEKYLSLHDYYKEKEQHFKVLLHNDSKIDTLYHYKQASQFLFYSLVPDAYSFELIDSNDELFLFNKYTNELINLNSNPYTVKNITSLNHQEFSLKNLKSGYFITDHKTEKIYFVQRASANNGFLNTLIVLDSDLNPMSYFKTKERILSIYNNEIYIKKYISEIKATGVYKRAVSDFNPSFLTDK